MHFFQNAHLVNMATSVSLHVSPTVSQLVTLWMAPVDQDVSQVGLAEFEFLSHLLDHEFFDRGCGIATRF